MFVQTKRCTICKVRKVISRFPKRMGRCKDCHSKDCQRRNNERYVPGNVQVLSLKANQMKTDLTPEQMRKYAFRILAQM